MANRKVVRTPNPLIRRGIYLAAAVIFFLLTIFGVVTAEQADALLEQVNTTVVPFLGTLLGLFSAMNTDRDSDAQVIVAREALVTEDTA